MADNHGLAAAIAAQSGMPVADVLAMLAAQDAINAGVAVQTVQRDTSNGDVAVRVTRGGAPGWWVITQSDGSATFDQNPDKQWPVLFTPEGAQ